VKDPALPSCYGPISLLDAYSSLFEKILLSKYLSEVSERGLICDEPFGFRPKHGTSLQLDHLISRVTMNFGDKRLTTFLFSTWLNPLILFGYMTSFTS